MTIEFSRDDLIDFICPSGAIYGCVIDCNQNCNDCSKDLNKILDLYDKHIRETVINEFMYKELDILNKRHSTKFGYLDRVDVLEIARELKEQT